MSTELFDAAGDALIRAARTHDPAIAMWSTLAVVAIDRAIAGYLRSEKPRWGSVPLRAVGMSYAVAQLDNSFELYNNPTDHREGDPAENAARREIERKVRSEVDRLDRDRIKVIEQVYGLRGGRGVAVPVAADALGITRGRAWHLHNTALSLLRPRFSNEYDPIPCCSFSRHPRRAPALPYVSVSKAADIQDKKRRHGHRTTLPVSRMSEDVQGIRGVSTPISVSHREILLANNNGEGHASASAHDHVHHHTKGIYMSHHSVGDIARLVRERHTESSIDPRRISELLYRRYDLFGEFPVVSGRKMIPAASVEAVIAEIRRAGLLIARGAR